MKKVLVITTVILLAGCSATEFTDTQVEVMAAACAVKGSTLKVTYGTFGGSKAECVQVPGQGKETRYVY